MMKFISGCKRILQSFDFRFNKIYNVKTPDLTEDSDGEEVANKNYVDDKTKYNGKSIQEALDNLINNKETIWELPELNFIDIIPVDFTENNMFSKGKDGRWNVFDNQSEQEWYIDLDVKLNDFIFSERDNIAFFNSNNVYNNNVYTYTFDGHKTLNKSKLIKLNLGNLELNRQIHPSNLQNTLSYICKFFEANQKNGELYTAKPDGEIITSSLNNWLLQKLNFIQVPKFRIVPENDISEQKEYSSYSNVISVNNIDWNYNLILEILIPTMNNYKLVVYDEFLSKKLSEIIIDKNNFEEHDSEYKKISVNLGYFGRQIKIKLYPI